MKRKLTRSLILLLVGGLCEAALSARLSPAQEYRPVTGYAFWSKADANVKVAYLLGYSDAEQLYRMALDKGAKPLCTDAGKAWIDDFDRKIPMPSNVTISQTSDGLDGFYKDWRNQSISLYVAKNIVTLQILGRPAPEIEELTRKARASSNQ